MRKGGISPFSTKLAGATTSSKRTGGRGNKMISMIKRGQSAREGEEAKIFRMIRGRDSFELETSNTDQPKEETAAQADGASPLRPKQSSSAPAAISGRSSVGSEPEAGAAPPSFTTRDDKH